MCSPSQALPPPSHDSTIIHSRRRTWFSLFRSWLPSAACWIRIGAAGVLGADPGRHYKTLWHNHLPATRAPWYRINAQSWAHCPAARFIAGMMGTHGRSAANCLHW